MPASELIEWMEYYEREPFGTWRDNWHSATIAFILANANRERHTSPIPFQDFMYQSAGDREREKDQAMIAFMDSKVTDGN